MAQEEQSISPVYRGIAALDLRSRRRAVRMLFFFNGLIARLRRRRPAKSGHAELFQRLFRLSRREALSLEREALAHDVAAEVEWLALRERSHSSFRRDVARTRIEGEDALARIARTGRPVILAPLHMGAYVMGIACTMLRFFPGRPLLVLRQRDDMPMETAVIERIREFGVEMRFLKVTEKADFLSAVRFARSGAVIVVFCDLPPSYGAPAPMPMFGLETSFAFGVDSLARLTGATVVPWSTTMEPGGDTVRIGRPFEVQGNTAEERAQVAGIMRAHIRDALRDRPEQWHLWATLDDYLPARDTIAEDVPANGGRPLRSAA